MKKNKQGFYLFPVIIILLSGIFLFSSCRKEDEEDDERIAVNEEFYRLMNDWYYWYDEMPSVNPSRYRSPYDLLEALRFQPGDRWSYISTRKEFEDYYRDSKFVGYGFGSAWHNNRLRVTFIYNSSDLYDRGVRRSWILDKVNGTTVAPGMNINQMLGANEVGVSNTFVFINETGQEVNMTVEKKELIMNTVLHKEVINTGSRNVGYLVFKNFTNPSFDELDAAVDFFNAEGIDDLILDLRYNGGGQTNVANYLASIIGGQKVAGKPFSKYLYNDKRAGNENFTDNFVTDAPSLMLDRLITIATGSTASASEMVINGLAPYMPVYIVGNDTYGKNMGMNAWFYQDMYAFVPVTFMIANSEDFGDYGDGLGADSYAADDITRAFGDPDEASLKEALNYIETGSFSSAGLLKSFTVQPFEQMTGIRREIGAH
jgi:carboxyl-terminal processing protease